jgi:hypothetical protein
MNCQYSLVEPTLQAIITKLQLPPSVLTEQRFLAIRCLLEALEDGLRGRLGSDYHLSSLDPGMGKTLSVTSFLSVWRQAGFKPQGSVLIAVSTKREIETFIEGAGLSKAEVAVVTRDDKTNVLGSDEVDHDSAPVLFTTHAMVQSRTRKRTFSDLVEFHFHEAPRSLRVWDESIQPAEWPILKVDDVAALRSPLRSRDPEYAQRLFSFEVELRSSEGERSVLVPENLGSPPSTKELPPGTKADIGKLKSMAGHEVLLLDAGQGDLSLGV